MCDSGSDRPSAAQCANGVTENFLISCLKGAALFDGRPGNACRYDLQDRDAVAHRDNKALRVGIELLRAIGDRYVPVGITRFVSPNTTDALLEFDR